MPLRRPCPSWRAKLALACLLMLAALAPAIAEPIDLALVLAVDGSSSIDSGEFDLQVQGYAAAFRSPAVLDAIRAGKNKTILVTYFQWGAPTGQFVAVPWTQIDSAETAQAFAQRIATQDRKIFGGGTAIGGAIAFGRKLLDGLGEGDWRRVIDISGDGDNYRGPEPAGIRDQAVAAGITINGLPILSEKPDLDDYFRKFVIGGPGAFVIPVAEFDNFPQAVLNKLVREIAGRDAAPPPVFGAAQAGYVVIGEAPADE